MANYLLLRNNKESGPFSLDDIIELGLKPYDLIWVQGRSAAWRYPSEVEELKAIAPAVEEQPYDRFYKKAEEKKDPIAIGLPIVSEAPIKKVVPEEPIKQEVIQETPIVKPEYEKYIPKKSVYVTMPGQKNTAAKEPIKETLPITPVQPTITISENPVAAQIKYSQPLDEIKEMYVKTLHDRKQKIKRKGFWLQNLKKAAALLSLVVAGLIIGYFIKSNKTGQKENTLQANTTAVAQPQPVKPEPLVNVPDTITANTSTSEINNKLSSPAQEVQTLHQPTGGFVNKPQQQDKQVEFKKLSDKPANDNSKKETETNPSENKPTINLSFLPQSLDANASTGERNRKVRNSNTENTNTVVAAEKKSILPEELSGLVSVKSNEYKKVAFGGIRDLQLTVINDSKYILENVIVELQYIKPNELPLKTENIQFTSIAPNAASTIRVPDTNRGIKVVFRIINVKKRHADERVADN
jgi:hypothetical protein